MKNLAWFLLVTTLSFILAPTSAFSLSTDWEKECARLASYSTGPEITNIQTDKAIRACNEALKESPDSASIQYRLGRALLANGNIELAVFFLEKAIKQDYLAAYAELAYIYRVDEYNLLDLTKSRKLIRYAAEKGNARAQNHLGWMYSTGNGVAKDAVVAVAWFRKAAEQGHAVAQNNLGTIYVDGRGVTRDEEQGVAWFRKAAEQGHAGSQNMLGVIYLKGVNKDEGQALAWFRKAAEQGYAQAQDNLDWMYRTGTGVTKDEGLAEAQNHHMDGRGVTNDFLSGLWVGITSKLAKGDGVPIAGMNLHSTDGKKFSGEGTISGVSSLQSSSGELVTVHREPVRFNVDMTHDNYQNLKFRYGDTYGDRSGSRGGSSRIGFGKVLIGGHPRIKYLKAWSNTLYGDMYMVKVDPLVELGGLYRKNSNDFVNLCTYMEYWISLDTSPNDLKRKYPMLLKHYKPHEATKNNLLLEDRFRVYFGKSPNELNERQWEHILWIIMDCAKYSASCKDFWKNASWMFEKEALTGWRKKSSAQFAPEKRLKTSMTPLDMVKWAHNVIDGRGIMADVLNKAKTVRDGPNGEEEFKKLVIESGARLTYAATGDMERFMMGVQERLSTLQAAAACARKYGLEVCRLPSDSVVEKIMTPDGMVAPPLSEAEKKRLDEGMRRNFREM